MSAYVNRVRSLRDYNELPIACRTRRNSLSPNRLKRLPRDHDSEAEEGSCSIHSGDTTDYVSSCVKKNMKHAKKSATTKKKTKSEKNQVIKNAVTVDGQKKDAISLSELAIEEPKVNEVSAFDTSQKPNTWVTSQLLKANPRVNFWHMHTASWRSKTTDLPAAVPSHLSQMLSEWTRAFLRSDLSEHLTKPRPLKLTKSKKDEFERTYLALYIQQMNWKVRVRIPGVINAPISDYTNEESSFIHESANRILNRIGWLNDMWVRKTMRLNLFALMSPPIDRQMVLYHGDTSLYTIVAGPSGGQILVPNSFWSCALNPVVSMNFGDIEDTTQRKDSLVPNAYHIHSEQQHPKHIVYEVHLPPGFPAVIQNKFEFEFILPYTLDLHGIQRTFGYRLVGQRNMDIVLPKRDKTTNISLDVRVVVPELLEGSFVSSSSSSSSSSAFGWKQTRNDSIKMTGYALRVPQIERNLTGEHKRITSSFRKTCAAHAQQRTAALQQAYETYRLESSHLNHKPGMALLQLYEEVGSASLGSISDEIYMQDC